MSDRRLPTAASLCLAAALLGTAAVCSGQVPRISVAQKRLIKVLDGPTELICQRMPPRDALAYLGRLHGIDIQFDPEVSRKLQLPTAEPVTERFEGVSLRSALRLLLRDLQLDYVVEGSTIVVIPEDAAEKRVSTVALPVGDLVGARAAAGAVRLGTIDLVRAIRECIAPETWKGGPYGDGRGTVRAVPPGEAQFLLVTQSGPVERRVEDFLDQVRYTVRCKGGHPSQAARRGSLRFAAEDRIRRVLDASAHLDWVGLPLAEAVADLRQRYEIPIRLDRRALADAGIAADAPVTSDLEGVSLGAALRLTLRRLGLTCAVDNEVLLITTPEDCESRLLSTRFHPVDEAAAARGPSGLYHVADDQLIDTVTSTVHPTGWQEVGGLGCVRVVREGPVRSLVVTQQPSVHEEIDALLDELRRAASLGAAGVLADGTVSGPSPAEKKIGQKLGEMTSIDFTEKPLGEVAVELADVHRIEIQLDRRAIIDVGIGEDTPVTMKLKGESLGTALRELLRPLDLVFEIRDEVLLITTPEEAESRLDVRVYPVTDLMPAGRAGGQDLDGIVEVILSTVRPSTWDSVGGPGSIAALSLGKQQVLVISQTFDVHGKIACLLGELRAAAARAAPDDGAGRPVRTLSGADDVATEADRKIAKALAGPTTLQFVETPLRDVVDCLKDVYGIEIHIDKRALKDVGIDVDLPITANFKGISLGTVLSLLLRESSLTYTVQDGLLLITTPEEAESRLDIRVYPVNDLVDRAGGREPDFDSLIDVITSAVCPTTWDEVGGPGSIAPITVGRAHALVFAQTYGVHGQVAQLLARLRGAAGRKSPSSSARQPTAEDRIERAMRTPITLDLLQAPLGDAVEQLERQVGVEIYIDKKSLEDAGIATDTPVSCNVRSAVLAHALDAAFRDVKLTWLVEDDVIVVTTTEEAEMRLATEVYAVDGLAAARLAPGLFSPDAEVLAEEIRRTIAPTTWDEVGGPGSIVPFPLGRRGVLVVSQTWVVHRELARALGRGPYRP